ncbi:MAG: NHL repeat-containing protein [Candidatus Coatesbacteria bacterium]|nr:MAG: NHL repeat-containing protein [Candidatus Coatesbacteria bacterium]
MVTLIGCGAERRGRYVEVAELSYPGDYWQPSGVAINDEDTVAVADISEMSVVHLFDGSGVLYATIGRMGKEPGELFVPVDAAFGPDGNLYVAEFGTKRVSVFEPDGVFLRVFGEDVLETPFGVAAGAGDTVYVVNADPPELLVFGTGGEIKDRWGERLGLVGPEDVAYRDGRLAVVDSAGGRVIVTDGDGNVLHEVVPLGDPAPMPVEAAWEPEGRLFVLARGRANEEERALVSCVLVYDEDGKLLERVDVDLPSPGALAVDSHGGIFIADGPAHSVKVYARREVEG